MDSAVIDMMLCQNIPKICLFVRREFFDQRNIVNIWRTLQALELCIKLTVKCFVLFPDKATAFNYYFISRIQRKISNVLISKQMYTGSHPDKDKWSSKQRMHLTFTRKMCAVVERPLQVMCQYTLWNFSNLLSSWSGL
jgi:hypothetical protein